MVSDATLSFQLLSKICFVLIKLYVEWYGPFLHSCKQRRQFEVWVDKIQSFVWNYPPKTLLTEAEYGKGLALFQRTESWNCFCMSAWSKRKEEVKSTRNQLRLSLLSRCTNLNSSLLWYRQTYSEVNKKMYIFRTYQWRVCFPAKRRESVEFAMVKSRNDIIIELDSHWVSGMFHNYK